MEEKFEVKTFCPFCRTYSFISVDEKAYNNWKNGSVSIFQAFPTLSDCDIEKLLSGICEDCSEESDSLQRPEKFVKKNKNKEKDDN